MQPAAFTFRAEPYHPTTPTESPEQSEAPPSPLPKRKIARVQEIPDTIAEELAPTPAICEACTQPSALTAGLIGVFVGMMLAYSFSGGSRETLSFECPVECELPRT